MLRLNSSLTVQLFNNEALRAAARAKLHNTGPPLTIHQPSWLVWTHSFIHYQAKQAAKYMKPRLNIIQITPSSFIHCRAKRAALILAQHSVVGGFILYMVKAVDSCQSFSNSIGHRSTGPSPIRQKERSGRVN